MKEIAGITILLAVGTMIGVVSGCSLPQARGDLQYAKCDAKILPNGAQVYKCTLWGKECFIHGSGGALVCRI